MDQTTHRNRLPGLFPGSRHHDLHPLALSPVAPAPPITHEQCQRPKAPLQVSLVRQAWSTGVVGRRGGPARSAGVVGVFGRRARGAAIRRVVRQTSPGSRPGLRPRHAASADW